MLHGCKYFWQETGAWIPAWVPKGKGKGEPGYDYGGDSQTQAEDDGRPEGPEVWSYPDVVVQNGDFVDDDEGKGKGKGNDNVKGEGKKKGSDGSRSCPY